MTRCRTRPRGIHADRGAAAVEFGIVVVALLLIIFGIIDFGRYLFVSQAVKSASREGARAAVVLPGTGSAVIAAVQPNIDSAAALAAFPATPPSWKLGTESSFVTVTSTDPRRCTGTNQSIAVRVSVNFRWFTPVGFLVPTTLDDATSTTTMRCE